MKFRFRVKTLLLATTVIAALVWAYWIALPDWQEYQQRKAFEQAVAQLEVGPERSLFEALDLKALNYNEDLLTFNRYNVDGKPVEITQFQFRNRWYLLHLVVESSERRSRSGVSTDWTEIYLYRYRPVPPTYRGKTERARRTRKDADGNEYSLSPAEQHLSDFQDVITGHAKTDLGIEYEVVFSNPPID